MALVQDPVKKEEQRVLSAISLKNVLFATDFSPTSEAALPYAAAICRRFGATLHAAHVISDASLLMMTGGVDYVTMGTIYDDAQNEAKGKLEHLADRFEGVPHRSHVCHGQVWKALARILEENEIDLIVVGTHGRTGLGKLLLGSVAEDILRHAPCPVLTVGPKVSGRARLPEYPADGRDLAPAELELLHILLATNLVRQAEPAVRAAVAMAGEFESRLTLLHVIEDYTELGTRTSQIEEGLRYLKAMVPKDAPLQYVPETLIEFGSAWDGILKVADERESDLIVLGARTAREVGTTHLPWSTAHHVIAHASCPVLTVRG